MDCISSIIGILSLPSRYKCYLVASDILFSCAFFFNLIAIFFTRIFPTTVISIIIECFVIFYLSKWLFVFRRYSREGCFFLLTLLYSRSVVLSCYELFDSGKETRYYLFMSTWRYSYLCTIVLYSTF